MIILLLLPEANGGSCYYYFMKWENDWSEFGVGYFKGGG